MIEFTAIGKHFYPSNLDIDESKKLKHWMYGVYMKHINMQPCAVGDKVRDEDIDHLILTSGFADWNMPRGIDTFRVDPKTVCWKCPETPYFEHDVLKVTDEDENEVIDEVFFHEGAFLFTLEEDEWVTITTLEDRGYKVELLGNTIDNPELLKQE